MKTKRSNGENQAGSPELSSCSNHATVSAGEQKRRETRLEILAGEPDLSALRLVMKEWLVPRLVDEFLRERGIQLKRTQTARANQQNELAKPIDDGT
jgi:hypothetical protein